MISVEWPEDNNVDWMAVARNFEQVVSSKDAEIARLQDHVEALTKERDEAKAEVARYWTSGDIKPWVDLAESKGLGHFGRKLKGMFSRAMKAEDEARIEYDRAEAAESERDRLREVLAAARGIYWQDDAGDISSAMFDVIVAALQKEPPP